MWAIAIEPSGVVPRCGWAQAMRTVVMGVLRDKTGMRSGRWVVMCSRSRPRALCRLALAAPGDAAISATGRPAIVQLDGAALPRWQSRDRRAKRLGPVEVLGGGQPLRRRRMEILGPVGQQQRRRSPGGGAVHVQDDPGQPGTEPVRVAQPVQGGKRLQERFLHDVVGVALARAEPHRAGQRRGPVPLDQQPERGRIARPGQPDQIPVADVHNR